MSREIDDVIVVTGARTIPTKPYGNERWEICVTRYLERNDVLSQQLYEMGEIIRHQLDVHEDAAISNANRS